MPPIVYRAILRGRWFRPNAHLLHNLASCGTKNQLPITELDVACCNPAVLSVHGRLAFEEVRFERWPCRRIASVQANFVRMHASW
jgi:hypothetical protein